MEPKKLEHLLESLLLVADKPLTVEEVATLLGEDSHLVQEAFACVQNQLDQEGRGFRLKLIAGGYQLVTDPEYADDIKAYVIQREKKKLSNAGLETLSIIAYKQPITRAEIEFIRGVNVDGAIKTLLEKNMIKISGRKEVPGRPLLYATTKEFLDHFGLSSLKELPKLAEFTEADIQLPQSLKTEESVALVSEGVEEMNVD